MKKKNATKSNRQLQMIRRLTYLSLGLSAFVTTASLSVYLYPELPSHCLQATQQGVALVQGFGRRSIAALSSIGKQASEDVPYESSEDEIMLSQNTSPEEENSASAEGGAGMAGLDSLSEAGTISFENVTLDTCWGTMTYYNQGDSRWANYPYGGVDPLSIYGCGPTATAMLINSFSTPNTTPVTTAEWSVANGCYAPQGGSYHQLIPSILTAYGFQVTPVTNRSVENIASLLASNHILVALMGKGLLTQDGHFILITRLLPDGNVSIADPNSYENSLLEWNPSLLLSELKKVYDNGAPLWAVSIAASN